MTGNNNAFESICILPDGNFGWKTAAGDCEEKGPCHLRAGCNVGERLQASPAGIFPGQSYAQLQELAYTKLFAK
jgi:hypothetical protein